MKLRTIGLVLLSTAALATPTTPATFTPAQTKAIQQMIRAEIQNNPISIIRSIQAFQKKSLQNEQQHSLAVAKTLKQSLVFNTKDPSIGPKNANVTIVEFMDYQCGHCRTMAKTIESIMSQDKNIRLVVKEWPIFKGNSLLAAKAAFAAYQQGKFTPIHHAIVNYKGPLNDTNLTTLARQSGLNLPLFNQARKSASTAQLVQQNFALAKQLGFQGTPAFIIASTYGNKMVVMPGAVPAKVLKSAIEQVRS